MVCHVWEQGEEGHCSATAMTVQPGWLGAVPQLLGGLYVCVCGGGGQHAHDLCTIQGDRPGMYTTEAREKGMIRAGGVYKKVCTCM